MAQIIDMPKLSDTMTVGTLVKWLKQAGDSVKAGDMLAEVETDKATMELESFFDGTLLKIFAPAGSQVAIGAALCAVGQPGEQIDAPAAPAQNAQTGAQATEERGPKVEIKPAVAAAPVAPPSPPAPASTPATGVAPISGPTAASTHESAAAGTPAPSGPPTAVPTPQSTGGARLRISPLARKLAAQRGVDPTTVAGTGPRGRIVKADILAAAASPTRAPSVAPSPALPAPGSPLPSSTLLARGPIQEERLVPASTMRATIARRLLEAKTQIPHFYLEIEVDAAPLLDLRAQVNDALADQGVKLSVNDYLLKAVAAALRRVPAVNASWTGNGIAYHAAAHVAFAVAIDDGLITPVIRDAHAKSVFQIAAEAKPLGQRAKAKKLKPDEFTGGTFCVSNLGMMGVHRFSAIINPPNAAILAVGATVEKPVVREGRVVVGRAMSLTLSCDHRVVDGALGAQFLVALRSLVEQPALLLL